MANVAIPPKLQFFDANGNPLVGGKLYTYAAGTTTPLTTYTSAAGTIPNTNPVILNSRGEAEVWLGTGQYKFKLTTSTDVEIWTVDNLNGADTATINAILAQLNVSGGAALIGYLPGGTNAVSTTVQQKLRQNISVFDFMTAAQIADVEAGTLGIDVTAAVQAAVSYASGLALTYNPIVSGQSSSAVGTMPTLYFPKGRYRISSVITLGAYIKIIGDYAVISQSTSTSDIFVGLFYEWTIEGITFVGGRFQIWYYNDNINAARVTIRDCDFTLSSSYAIKSTATGGTFTHLSANVLIENCRFLAPNKVFDNCSDIAKVADCWVQVEKTTMTDGTAAFNNQASTGFPRLIIDNMIGVPVMGSGVFRFDLTRWVDNYYSFSAYDTRFGGEDAGMSIVHQLAGQDTSIPWSASEINLDRCWLYAGVESSPTSGVIFLQGYIPNRIAIKNCSGPVSSPFIVNPGINLATYFSNWQSITGLPSWQYFCMDINNNIFSPVELSTHPYASAGRIPIGLRTYMATTGAVTRQMKLVTSGSQSRGPTDPIQFAVTSFNSCGIFSGATPTRIYMPAGCSRAQIHVVISVLGTTTAKNIASFVRNGAGAVVQGTSGWHGNTASPGVDIINYVAEVTGTYGEWFDVVVQQPSGAALDIPSAFASITPMDYVG
jgi:hypothetical protein